MGGIFDVFLSLFRSRIYEKKVLDQRFQKLLLFTINPLTNVTLGNIDIRAVFYDIVRSLVLSAVRGTEHIPPLVWCRHILYRHPCL